jgi:hypothetical protein
MNYKASCQTSMKLHLKSEESTSSLSSTNKTFILRTPIEPTKHNHRMLLSITDFSFPIVYYLVDSFNQILSFSLDSVLYELIIPVGGYNVITLKKKIIELFDANVSGYILDLSFDNDTLKYTFNIIKFADTTLVNMSMNITPFSKIIGFSGIHSYTSITSGLNTVSNMVSNNIVNFVKTKFLKVKSNSFITHNINSYGENDDTIASFAVREKNHGDELTFQSTDSIKYLLGTDKIQNINLIITDDDDKEIDIHNHNWSITIQVDFTKNIF